MSGTKRLYKSEDDRKISGVCAGLAEYFGTDPLIFRVSFILVVVFTGIFPGVIAYFVLALVMPNKSEVIKHGQKRR